MGLALRDGTMFNHAFDADQPGMPESIEHDPFEMDWPWPGMRSDKAEDTPALNAETAAQAQPPVD